MQTSTRKVFDKEVIFANTMEVIGTVDGEPVYADAGLEPHVKQAILKAVQQRAGKPVLSWQQFMQWATN